MSTKALVLLGVFSCAVGCSSAEPSGSSAPAQADDPSAVVSRTIVHLSADGTKKVTTETVTRAAQLEEIAARTAYLQGTQTGGGNVGATSSALLTEDLGCAGSSLWLFDQPNLQGNEICFKGPGEGDLFDYTDVICGKGMPYCAIVTWSGSVRSLWAGVDSGYFVGCAGVFNAWQRLDTLPPLMQNGRYLTFTTDLCPIH
jgi:hypothetical protein